jgi:hypothetical protein
VYVSKYDSVGSILFELVGVKSYVVVPEVSDQTGKIHVVVFWVMTPVWSSRRVLTFRGKRCPHLQCRSAEYMYHITYHHNQENNNPEVGTLPGVHSVNCEAEGRRVGFEVLAAVTVKMTVFCDVILRSMVVRY